MHDAIELEKKGIPSTVLVTKPFDTQAKAMTTILGLPGFRYTIIDHPMGSLNDEQIMGRARQAIDQVLSQIVG